MLLNETKELEKMSKQPLRKKASLKTNPKLLRYINSQITANPTLEEDQRSLSNIGISLSERVKEERERR